MSKILKTLDRIPDSLLGHLSKESRAAYFTDTDTKLGFFSDKKKRDQWMEDVAFVGEYAAVTPNKARIAERRAVLDARAILEPAKAKYKDRIWPVCRTNCESIILEDPEKNESLTLDFSYVNEIEII